MSTLESTEELLTDIVKESGITGMITDMKIGSEKYDEYIKEVTGMSLRQIYTNINNYREELREYLDKKNNKIYNAMICVYLFACFCDEYEQSGEMRIGDDKCEYGPTYNDNKNGAIIDFFEKKLKDYKDGDEIVIDDLQINLYVDDFDYSEATQEAYREIYGLETNDFIDHVCKYYDVKITVNNYIFFQYTDSDSESDGD